MFRLGRSLVVLFVVTVIQCFFHWFFIPQGAIHFLGGVAVDVVALALMTGVAFSICEMFDYIQTQATRDPLTGLLNRRAFTHRAELTLQSAQSRGTWLVLLVLDLDGFKEVNDTKGHASGDELLIQFAKMAEASLR